MSEKKPTIKCNKETLDAIALRLTITKYSILSIILACIIILIVGAEALGIVAYIGKKTWWVWLLLFFLFVPAIFTFIASTAANLGANACNDAIKKGTAEALKDKDDFNLQSFTPFFAAPFSQFRSMFKSI